MRRYKQSCIKHNQSKRMSSLMWHMYGFSSENEHLSIHWCDNVCFHLGLSAVYINNRRMGLVSYCNQPPEGSRDVLSFLLWSSHVLHLYIQSMMIIKSHCKTSKTESLGQALTWAVLFFIFSFLFTWQPQWKLWNYPPSFFLLLYAKEYSVIQLCQFMNPFS